MPEEATRLMTVGDASDLYLDLMKRVLTRSLFLERRCAMLARAASLASRVARCVGRDIASSPPVPDWTNGARGVTGRRLPRR